MVRMNMNDTNKNIIIIIKRTYKTLTSKQFRDKRLTRCNNVI